MPCGAPPTAMDEPRVEVELKYAADAAALEALAAIDRLGPAEVGPAIVNDETDRYLDTADGRLAAAAWACRLRTRRVHGVARTFVSLKGPAEAVAGAMHRRPELEGPATDAPDPAAWPASAARDFLATLAAGAPLTEGVVLEQRRRERPVRLAGRTVATLSLDEARILRVGVPLGELRVVELELADGVDAPVEALAAALERVPGLRADQRSKLEHALTLVAATTGSGR